MRMRGELAITIGRLGISLLATDCNPGIYTDPYRRSIVFCTNKTLLSFTWSRCNRHDDFWTCNEKYRLAGLH